MNGNVNLVEEQRMHSADAVRNTNSKNIFREPMLYAQFLRNNLNLPALKNVQPEYTVDVIASVKKALCVKIDAGEAEARADEAEKHLEEAEKELKEAEKRAKEAEQFAKEAQEELKKEWEQIRKERERNKIITRYSDSK